LVIRDDGALSEFSDYIVFVDESGSPTLSPIDPNHPVFVLVFCVIKKSVYCDVIQPAIKRLKFEFFGHDMTVLHSADIRKRRGEFNILMNQKKREAFLERLDGIIISSDVNITASVIDKTALVDEGLGHKNPYHIGMDMCLLRLDRYLRDNHQDGKLTHIIAEARGKAEDKDLMAAFEHSVSEFSKLMPKFGSMKFKLQFAEKKINSAGLQLADLFGHPIGRHVINPSQPNHAFDIVKDKIWQGLFRFSIPESERPRIAPRPNAD
jgi:Protein of unknown function (DUF3800)